MELTMDVMGSEAMVTGACSALLPCAPSLSRLTSWQCAALGLFKLHSTAIQSCVAPSALEGGSCGAWHACISTPDHAMSSSQPVQVNTPGSEACARAINGDLLVTSKCPIPAPLRAPPCAPLLCTVTPIRCSAQLTLLCSRCCHAIPHASSCFIITSAHRLCPRSPTIVLCHRCTQCFYAPCPSLLCPLCFPCLSPSLLRA